MVEKMNIMEVYKKEWWDSEINEKFRALNSVIFLLLSIIGIAKLCVHFSGLYTYKLQDLVIMGVPILLSVISSYFSRSSSYLKISYSLLVTEFMNMSCLGLCEQYSQGDHLILFLTATVILVCLQLSFFYSRMATTLLILKFQYQWYIKHLLDGTLDTLKPSIPISGVLACIVFYQYYRHFQMNYSYNYYQANKNLELSQKEISSLLKLIPGGLLVISQDLNILHTNHNTFRFLGANNSNILEKLEDVQYIQNKKMTSLTNNNYVFNDIKQCFHERENHEFVLGVTPGNLEWRSKHVTWIDKKAVVIIIQDIDQIMRLEKQSNEILFKNLLLSSASHELRNPTLTVSEYSSHIIEQEINLSERAKENLRIICNSSKLLLSLIGDILDFSTMVSGDFNVQKKECNPREIIEDCYDIFKFQMSKKNLKFEKRIDPNLPSKIYTDPIRLKQILINLISNAKKFTLRGFIEICAIETSSGNLRITVKDTGVGIKPEDREKIFDPWKTERDPIMNNGGCGLGLTISNILAYKLGGAPIKVRSILGQGSIFSFKIDTHNSLSFSNESEDESDMSELEYHNVPITFPSNEITPAQVLIVDDETNIRNIVGTILDKARVTWNEAASGTEAVDIVKKYDLIGKGFSVVIMDVEMAGMNGWTATKIIRDSQDINKQPFIIGYSANDSQAYLENCHDSGMDLILKKPTKAEDLINIISSILK